MIRKTNSWALFSILPALLLFSCEKETTQTPPPAAKANGKSQGLQPNHSIDARDVEVEPSVLGIESPAVEVSPSGEVSKDQ